MTTEFIISGVIGLFTGAADSLVAPWIHWGIKKRELRHKERIDLINEVRKEFKKEYVNKKVFR